jgi:uncharacterized protein (TIGR03067 family)
MTKALVTLAVVLCVAVVCGQDQAETEKKALHGNWDAVAFEEDGKQARARLLETLSCSFMNNEFVWRLEGTVQLKGTYKLKPEKKPKEIDLFDPDRKAKFVGIYEIQGGTLKIRFHQDKQPRPKEFTTEKGTRDHFLLVLKRAKK